MEVMQLHILVCLVNHKLYIFYKVYKQYLIFLFIMNIKIDNRETDLIQLCQLELAKVLAKPTEPVKNKDSKKDKNNINIEVLPLPIGDIILEYLGKEIIIIERKSAADLEASIKDGRYEEQSYRLSNSEVHNHNIIYLIEGSLILIRMSI